MCRWRIPAVRESVHGGGELLEAGKHGGDQVLTSRHRYGVEGVLGAERPNVRWTGHASVPNRSGLKRKLSSDGSVGRSSSGHFRPTIAGVATSYSLHRGRATRR